MFAHRRSLNLLLTFFSSVVPDSEKSSGQSAADKMGRSKDDAVHGGTDESVLDKTKNALGLGDKH
jgi:hypothetical protein